MTDNNEGWKFYRYYFQCYCGKRFWNYSDLMKHQLSKHKLNNETSYETITQEN